MVLHAIDGSDPEPLADRLERVRAGLEGLQPAGAREIVVATAADPDDPPDGVDAAVEAEDGTGIEALRERVLAELRGG